MSTFTSPSDITPLALARSANVNDLSSATATAFALIPDETLLENGTVQYGTCAGAANAYTLTLAHTPASYADGMVIVFKANHLNTGAATVDVNSLGAKSLKSYFGSALEAGDLAINRFYSFRYNSISGNFEMMQPAQSEVAGTGSWVTYLDVATDTSPSLGGDLDTNEFDILVDSGYGILDESGNDQLLFTTTATAVNYFVVVNAATGNAPQLQAAGSDTDISINIVPKGAGTVQLGGVAVVTLSGTQTLTNKTLTSPVLTTPQINDTSVDHQYIFAVNELAADRTVTLPLLTGNDEFAFKDHTQTFTNKTLTSPTLTTPKIADGGAITDASGNEQIKFSTTASAVNEITVKNAATGNGPEIQATGSDTNIDIELVPKGTGAVNLLDALLSRAKMKDTSSAVSAATSSGGTLTINLETANIFTITLTENITTFDITNWLASTCQGCVIFITQAAAAKTVDWSNESVIWSFGEAPDLSTNSSKHVVAILSPDGGTTVYGFHSSEEAA
ncbi:hypothetical protein LDC_1178 [sediment metagenome]|uniref:Uncharacterized protein n=1 Tax=sediment metagenome TaxID=749907 RepID=D9PI24_9ZZZZ